MNHNDDNSNLSPHVLKRVDDAFSRAARTGDDANFAFPTTSGKSGVETSAADSFTPGGFIIDDSADSAGGFLIDEDEDVPIADDPANDSSLPTHIPLSQIPFALDLLNLPSDDPDILDVFHNAADGWGGRTAGTSQDGREEKFVSRSDWRAVCSALLPPEPEDSGELDERIQVDEDEEGGDITSSLSEISDEDSDDEYREDVQPRKRARLNTGKGKGKEQDSGSDLSPAGKATRTRKSAKSTRSNREVEETCRETFRLFFPNVAEQAGDKDRLVCKDCGSNGHSSLPDCQLTIADVMRAMRSAGEKFTVEDVKEMVALFPDEKLTSRGEPVMSFAIFKQMMNSANLL